MIKTATTIIILAFPETIVRNSSEFLCRIFPYLGIGNKRYTRAGHAALVVVLQSGQLEYYDFGRYISPPGKGRVRSCVTDSDVLIPFTADFDAEGSLTNLHEILSFIEAHPGKTHGTGRMLASICDAVDYERLKKYILELQRRGSLPYGVFVKDGSNCARFVTDALIAGVTDKKIVKRLKKSRFFTPSTVGNVFNGRTGKVVYQVYKGVVSRYKGSAWREHWNNLLDRNGYPEDFSECLPPKRGEFVSEKAQWLGGAGSGAWFEMVKVYEPGKKYRIRRISPQGVIDVDGIFSIDKGGFDPDIPYSFIYDSNCSYCHVVQNDKRYRFSFLKLTEDEINSKQREHTTERSGF